MRPRGEVPGATGRKLVGRRACDKRKEALKVMQGGVRFLRNAFAEGRTIGAPKRRWWLQIPEDKAIFDHLTLQVS